jgi:hypothetical protein
MASECPGVIKPADGPAKIYFEPSTPIPGTFEGKQVVDGTLLARYLRSFYVYFVWVVGILATVMIMYAGIQWITAAGNSSRIENAKSTMNGALIGLVLALTSVLILRSVNPTLVRFDSLSIFTVPTVLINENSEQSEKGAPAVPYPVDVSNVANVNRWDAQITTLAAEYGLDRDYVKAIMIIESSGNPNAVSPAGACGLLQVMPANSNNTCLKGESNVEANMRAGMQLMKNLMNFTCPRQATYKSGSSTTCTPSNTKCTNHSWHYVIAAYNGGLAANCSSKDCSAEQQTWWECEVNAGFAETRRYVAKVEAMVQRVQQWGWNGGGAGGQCSDLAALAQANNAIYPAQDSPALVDLKNCIANNVSPDLIDQSQIYTIDETHPACNYTHGETTCGACSHTVHSCHYGGVAGSSGAEGVDYNANLAGGHTEAELKDAIFAALDGPCAGKSSYRLGHVDHTHISTSACNNE